MTRTSIPYQFLCAAHHPFPSTISLVLAGGPVLCCQLRFRHRCLFEPSTRSQSALLRTILLTLNQSAVPSEAPAVLPIQEDPPCEIITVTGPMRAIFLISQPVAFVVMLGKQWLNRYLQDLDESMIERCGDSQRKCGGLEKWPLNLFVESLPVMLQVSLLACRPCRRMCSVNRIHPHQPHRLRVWILHCSYYCCHVIVCVSVPNTGIDCSPRSTEEGPVWNCLPHHSLQADAHMGPPDAEPESPSVPPPPIPTNNSTRERTVSAT